VQYTSFTLLPNYSFKVTIKAKKKHQQLKNKQVKYTIENLYSPQMVELRNNKNNNNFKKTT